MINVFGRNDTYHLKWRRLAPYFVPCQRPKFMIKYFVIYVVAAMSLTSCYYNKKLVYLQDRGVLSRTGSIENKTAEYRIKPNDVLSIKVKSATDPLVSDIFNIAPGQGSWFSGSPGSLYLEGYSVNSEGQITLPIIGVLTVKDMKLDEIQDLVQKSVQKYLNNATVLIKLVSFKITVLGEVNTPGYHFVYNNQATVLEAIGIAGDLTKYGNRKNIKLIRQTNGKPKVVLLDLTDAALLGSEYYYLMPNDVLYVEPLKATVRRLNLDLLGVVFSAATTAILILNYVDEH